VESANPPTATQLAEIGKKKRLAKKGEQVSAATAFPTCGPEASKTGDRTGKEAEPAPRLDPRVWSMSTAQQRQVFVKAVGRGEIEDAFYAIELPIDAGFKHLEPSMDCGNGIRPTYILQGEFSSQCLAPIPNPVLKSDTQ
jgi:hypothetical protein